MIRAALLALALATPALAAAAEARPQMAPTRDVDVTYRLRGDQTLDQRMRWLVAQRRMRLDPPTPGVFLILDYNARQLSVVHAAQRTVSRIEGPPPPPSGLPEGTGFTRTGTDTVAGTPCTEWTVGGADALSVCLTDDGVLLRERSRGEVVVTALRVSYAPQDAADFQIPADYQVLAP